MALELVTAELILLVLRAGRLAAKELALANLESLPPETRAALIKERDELNTELARLNSLGKPR